MQERGIQALGLWGQVPHYVSAMPYPAASAALVGAVQMVAGLSIDVADLRAEAVLQRERIDKLVSGNAEHLQMVQQLETAFDEAVSAGNIIADTQSSGSGDAIADEIESFLREQNDLGN
jgi:hypothetical protein